MFLTYPLKKWIEIFTDILDLLLKYVSNNILLWLILLNTVDKIIKWEEIKNQEYFKIRVVGVKR